MALDDFIGSVCLLNSARQQLLIDAADLALLPPGPWSIKREPSGHMYAVRWVSGRLVRLHRILVNAPAGFDVDHADRNGLNNRRANLRVCSRSQNNCNQRRRRDNNSGFKGVYRHGKGGTKVWMACLKLHGKRVRVGLFASPEEAAAARDAAARRIHGQFAR